MESGKKNLGGEGNFVRDNRNTPFLFQAPISKRREREIALTERKRGRKTWDVRRNKISRLYMTTLYRGPSAEDRGE